MTAEQPHDDAFFEALENCRRRMRSGEPLAACLALHPRVYHEEIAALLAVGARVAQAAPEPAPAFVARFEPVLLAAVDEARREARAQRNELSPVGRLRGLAGALRARAALRAAAVALLAGLVLAGSGVAVVEASGDALPGEPLYRVTRWRETAELWLARSDSARLDTRQQFLARRTLELERAAARQAGAARAAEAERNLGREVRQLVDRAVRLRERGDTRATARALTAVHTARSRVTQLAATAPDPERRSSLLRLDRFLAAQERRLREVPPAAPTSGAARAGRW
ncbi:MAG: hypothetical protein O3B31_08450 [Chloroflexi bacterium]|nr:hypothetical protein [Chloroflexota bacterium]